MNRINVFVLLVFFLSGCGFFNKIMDRNGDDKNAQTTDTIVIDDSYIVTNEGIAGLKIGMSIDEITTQLLNLEYEKVIIELDEVEYYVLKSGEKQICQFYLDQYNTVRKIIPDNPFKTKEKIGVLSTIKQVKKKYTIKKYEIVEGAEGAQYIALITKEMPNLQMWIDFPIPENYHSNKKEVLKSIPESSKITNIFIEQSID